MTNFIRMTSLAATVAALALTATSASAATTGTPVGPTDKNATATARIVKPLTLAWKQDLDLGTIVLNAGAYTNSAVGITKGGVFSCDTAHLTCSGSPTTAEYTITGTNNQDVFVNASNVTLTNQNDGTSTLTLTVDNPGKVNLGTNGAGKVFDLGGSIAVANNTPDGTYFGTFAVTVNY
jgi:hypothetical protein